MDINSPKEDSPDVIRTRSWILYSSLGWIVGVVCVILISGPFEAVGLGKTAVGLGMAGGVSLAQWYVLRRYHPRAALWFAASIVGMGVPFLLIDLFRSDLPLTEEERMILSTAVGALCLSGFQYRWVLRPNVALPSWLMANLAAWLLALAFPFVFSVSRINSWPLPVAVSAIVSFASVLCGGLIIGWLTRSFIRRLGHR